MPKAKIERMWEKVDRLLGASGRSQADLSRMTGLRPSRFSKWRGGTGSPTALEALRIARALGTTVEYLADDQAEEGAVGLGLADDERHILWDYRALKAKGLLDVDRAIVALALAARDASAPVVLPAAAHRGTTIVGQPHDPETGRPLPRAKRRGRSSG